jgi:glycosyltransferase involved in cell wall biosynthesis
MDNAKLIVNAMQYRDGAHERVFYGLSRGAAILSDPSRFLAAAEAARAGIAFFPEDPAALDDAVASLLASPLDDTVAEGRRWYADRHTWDHRAARLLDLVTPLF